MGYFMNVISVAVFLCSFVKNTEAQGAQVQANDNSEQFALLCRIYNVAKNPPINHVDLLDPLKIVREIDAINASFAEENQLNVTEQIGNSSDPLVKPVNTREAAVAQANLRRITQNAHTVLEEIINTNATRDIEKVKGEFDRVIFGEGGNESHLCVGALNGVSDRAAACGKPGLTDKGNSAGKNLVVDFFCLCAMTTDSNGIGSVCGIEVGGNSGKKNSDNHGWGTANGPSGSSSMWASIKKGCGNLLHKHPKSTQEGHEVLRDFLKHLKSGGLYRWGDTRSNTIKGSNRKEGMLGTGVGTKDAGKDILCDGRRGYTGRGNSGKPPGGVCVYYGQESEWQSIPWLKQFNTALVNVDAVNNQTASIKRDIEKLQMLLHRAEKIYETTKVITEVQNPVVPTNLSTAAKRLTAYSATPRHHLHTHFMLLFVLL